MPASQPGCWDETNRETFMTITERVKQLRQDSLDAVETLSGERARLMTDFYRQDLRLVSVPMQRALSFQYLMEHKSVVINPGELIVGEKGDAAKAAPTFPELCCHSLDDLDLLNSREKIPFGVAPETRSVYEDSIIPFWQGHTMRDLIFEEMSPAWLDTYNAGIFTEFMEQRAPGHTVLDDKIYESGMLDFIQRIDEQLQKLDYLNDADAYSKQEELKAMRICARALIRYAERHAELALKLSETEKNAARIVELQTIADICQHVPANAPRSLWEALQYYWLVHLGVTTELNTWDSFCPGRLDQHLLPFYEEGLADGSLTRESA